MQQTILVTGGSEGIGRAIITRLKPAGAQLINLARDTTKGKAAAQELGNTFIACDISDYDAVERAVGQVIDQYGQIDAVINNAGLWIQGPLDDNDPVRMRDVVLANTLGVLNVSRAVIPAMKTAGRGTIINIGSSAGLVTKPDMATYDASKWGVTGLSRALQQELAPFGIRVTCVYPGKVQTGLFASAGNVKTFEDALQADDVARAVEFVLSLDPAVCIPDLSIRHL